MPSCPPAWHLSGGLCWRRVLARRSFPAAREECERQNGSLPLARDSQENMVVDTARRQAWSREEVSLLDTALARDMVARDRETDRTWERDIPTWLDLARTGQTELLS